MSHFDLSKRRWLFCMTHPDDEISICAWMSRLAANGNEVFISWTHSNPVREAESRKVADLLGVPQANLTFHGATDGKVGTEFDPLLTAFRDMVQRVKPDVIACGAFEQGHPDHDTTNVLVNSAFEGDVLEIPFYHTYATKLQQMNSFSDPTGQSIIVLTPDEVKLKRQVAKLFVSQNIWSVLLWFEVWQAVQCRQSNLSSREVMRLQGHKLFRVPNHPPSLAKKIEQTETWRTWCDQVLPHIPG
jgi:LmbE family N-acetylglucosaminyl deacetylase